MVSYPNSLHDGCVVSASLVRGRKKDFQNGFTCIACGMSMIARTDGEFQEPHFGHKPNTYCNPETYLHRLAKLRFKEIYDQCLASQQPFTISLPHPATCQSTESFYTPFGKGCPIQRCTDEPDCYIHREWDLTTTFDRAELETKAGNYVADVLLFNSADPQRRIMIEFVVTNDLSFEKKNSGEKIISIRLSDEKDLEFIEKRKIRVNQAPSWGSSADIESFGFNAIPQSAECQCHSATFRLVVSFINGRLKQEIGPLTTLTKWYAGVKDRVKAFRIYVECYDTRRYLNGVGIDEEGSVSFFRAAQEIGKNCFGCSHRKESYTASAKGYCAKLRKVLSNSNEGANCKHFSRNSVSKDRLKP